MILDEIKYFQIILGSLLFCCLKSSNFTYAQIIPDKTLGTSNSVLKQSIVNETPSDVIEGGIIQGRNQFHSFEQFNVALDRGAYFTSPGTVQNIITRVTGANSSNILGTLGVLGNANLFLINPNGIFFGSESQLKLNGSFLASTAERIVFDHGLEFSATNPNPPSLLMVNLPTGLRFGETPGPISVSSLNFLTVMPERTMSLIGGDISIKGAEADRPAAIYAPGARIEIGSVGGHALVSLNPVFEGWTFGYDNVQEFQDINLSNYAFIDTSGQNNGAINIRGRQLNLTNKSGIVSNNEGENPGKDISIITTDSVLLLDDSEITNATSGLGSSGNIQIKTGTLKANYSFIDTSNNGNGLAGNLKITASQDITIDASRFSAKTFGTMNGGNIILEARQIFSRNGGQISSSTNQSGDAGNVTITASDLIEISGANGTNPSGFFSTSAPNATGNAGTIRINSDRVIIRQGAQASVSSAGTGEAGNLEINALSLLLEDQGVLEAKTRGGEGNIVLNSNDIILRRNSLIATDAQGIAKGGNIIIQTHVLTALENSDITANAQDSQGGRVSLTAQGVFGIQFREQLTPESDITASSDLGPEFSGTVDLNIIGIDPSQGLAELPTTVIDPNALVTQNSCRRGLGSALTHSGQGGLPPTLSQDWSAPAIQVGLVEPNSINSIQQENNTWSENEPFITQALEDSGQRLPAQGWIYSNKGEVLLVADKVNLNDPQRLTLDPRGCPVF